MKPFTLGDLTADLIYVKETHKFHNVSLPYLAFRQNELPNVTAGCKLIQSAD